jgi:hypothetical protein
MQERCNIWLLNKFVIFIVISEMMVIEQKNLMIFIEREKDITKNTFHKNILTFGQQE